MGLISALVGLLDDEGQLSNRGDLKSSRPQELGEFPYGTLGGSKRLARVMNVTDLTGRSLTFFFFLRL